MKERRYKELRGASMAMDYTQETLARRIGRSYGYVNQRFNATKGKEWMQSDMYAIMDALKIPYEQMHAFFPKGGISVRKRSPSASLRGSQEIVP